MAIECRSGNFLTGVGAVASTIKVTFSTNMATAPTIVIVYYSGRTEATDTVGRLSQKRGIGVFTSATNRACLASYSLDANTAADTATRITNADCLAVILNGTTVDGAFDCTSMDTDGFTLDVTNQFATSYRIHYWALAGTTAVEVGTMTAELAIGNKDTVLAGAFQPDIVMLLAAQTTSAIPATVIDDMFMFGAATGPSNQAVIVGGSNDGSANMVAKSSSNGSDIVAITSSSFATIVARAQFVQFNTDGFRLNWTEVSGNAHDMIYIAIKGGLWKVGDSLTQTDTTTDINITGLGGTPVGGLIFSTCAAEDAPDVLHANDQWSFGAWSENTTTRGVHATLDEDTLGSSEVSAAVEFDEVYANIDTASAIQGLMDIKTVGSDGITLIMDDADPAQNFFGYVLVGNASASAVVTRNYGFIIG